MWIEIYSALFTLISTVIISAGLYKKRNINKWFLMLFAVFTIVFNFISNITLPKCFTVVVFITGLSLYLKYVLRVGTPQSVLMSMLIAFVHRLFMLLYFVILFLLDGKTECEFRAFYSMIYSLVFLNVIACVVAYLYNKYRYAEKLSENTIKILHSLDFIILKPKLFGTLYIVITVIDTLFIGICTKMQFVSENYTFYIGALFLTLMYSLLMILTLTMIQGLLMSEADLTAKNDEVESLKNYTETIENLVDEMQKSRHDYKNMLLSIREYVVEKRVDELETYYNEQILKSENIEKVSKNIYLSTKQIKNLPLKSIINAKLNEALSNGIKVEITIFNEVTIKSVSDIDMCRIIGNLLDNAVDSALKSEDKVISLIMLKNNNQYSITLCNSFNGEVDLSKIWKKGYSTKGKNRGLGLPIVKKIIEKEHTNILLNTEIKNNLFVQDITIIEQ